MPLHYLRLRVEGKDQKRGHFAARDVVIPKTVRERSQKLAILKQLQTHFRAKHEKGMGTPLPRVPAPLHPCLQHSGCSSLFIYLMPRRLHWLGHVCRLSAVCFQND